MRWPVMQSTGNIVRGIDWFENTKRHKIHVHVEEIGGSLVPLTERTHGCVEDGVPVCNPPRPRICFELWKRTH